MNEREAFEKWWTIPPYQHAICAGEIFEVCFTAWQAATQVERERCAKVCEYEQYKLDRYCSAMGFGYTDPVDGKMCAAAIRKGEAP